MTTPSESVDCSGCPACVWAEKEREAEAGLRCKTCLTSFDEVWPVQSEVLPDLCRRCASAAPASGRGDTWGTHAPLTSTESDQTGGGGVSA